MTDEQIIEAMARAMVPRHLGMHPDEPMPNDGPRWRYYAEMATAALAVAKQHLAPQWQPIADAPQTILVERSARASLKTLERAEAAVETEDRSHSEHGTIDAHVVNTATWFGKPALQIKERLSGKVIYCVLSEDLAAREGPSHSWADAWAGKRIRVAGTIIYDKDGKISRVGAVEMKDVSPRAVDLNELRQIDLLEGKSPVEHLDKLWGYSND
jgi:hypothetical protein